MLSVFGHGSHQKPLSGTAANGAKLVYLELAANLIINKFISANFLDCHAWGREWVLPRDFGYEPSNHDRHSDGKDNEGPPRGWLSVCKSGDDLGSKKVCGAVAPRVDRWRFPLEPCGRLCNQQ